MAVPTVHVEKQGGTSQLVTQFHKLRASLGRPLFAVLLALVVSGVIIVMTTPGSFSDRFSAVLSAYQYLFTGSFGNVQNAAFTLVMVTSLIFTGLSVAIAFRAGLFNIGAEGQLAVGAVAAGVLALKLPNLSGWILVPLMIIASALAGAVWGGIVGLLKAWRGAHEVVTTIMLNWIAFYVADFLIDGPFQAPHLSEQTLPLPPQATLPLLADFYNRTLGVFLPKIADPTSYAVDVSILFALIALIIYWFITKRTTFGYEQRIIGQNPGAARYAGIPVKRNIIMTMALAGAFSGLAGSLHLMGQLPYQLLGSSFSSDATGFNAIGVALLGRTSAIGVLLAALLFGGLLQAGSSMQLLAHIPGDLINIIQALVLFSIAAEFLPAIQRALPGWMLLGRKPSLVPNITGSTELQSSPAGAEPPPPEEITAHRDEKSLNAATTPVDQEE